MKIRELFVASLIRLYARLLKQGFDIIPARRPELILVLTTKVITLILSDMIMSRLYRCVLYRNNNFRSAGVRASHSLLRGPGQAGRTAKQGRIPMLPYLILLVHILVCSNCRRRTPV